MKQKVMRPLGLILGLLFFVVGILMIIDPIHESFLEKINAITTIVLALIFIAYGFGFMSRGSSVEKNGE